MAETAVIRELTKRQRQPASQVLTAVLAGISMWAAILPPRPKRERVMPLL